MFSMFPRFTSFAPFLELLMKHSLNRILPKIEIENFQPPQFSPSFSLLTLSSHTKVPEDEQS